MYVCRGAAQADDQDMMDSILHCHNSFVNPIIYSLRNKKVIDSLTKMLKRNSRYHANKRSFFIKTTQNVTG